MSDIAVEGFYLFLANAWIVPIGVLIGMFVGAMPGLSSSGTLAMMLPILMALAPEQALILGVNIYAGAEMGNSFPSVMLNIPGTPGGAVTAFDGYPLMKKGLAARALGICIMASTIGAIIGGLAAITLAPPIGSIALKFGPAEFCIVILFGLTVIAQLSEGGLAKGLLAGFFGLLLASTGTDPTFGQFRGTFGIVYLFDQLPLIAVLVGLLGFSEVLVHAEGGVARLLASDVKVPAANVGLRGILTGFVDTLKRPIEILRAGLIGLSIGAMPGAGASVATFVSYQQSIAFAPPERKKTYGKGSFEGLIAADTTNNAVVGGALVPLLTLAIPGSGSMAVLLVVMIFHGLYVGPRLFEFSGDIAYAVMWSQFAGAFFVLIIGTILAYFAYRVALINLKIIIPVISAFCILGSFAKNAYVFDMGLMVGFGCLGLLMKKYNYPVVALLLGVILGPMFEANLMRAWRIGFGEPGIFFQSTISQVLWALFALTFFVPPLVRFVKGLKKRKAAS
jgi:putative tricarboxylic transport membrane protein